MSLEPPSLSALHRFARKAGDRETGGILAGDYNEALDCARVVKVSAPPRDSRAGAWSFERGIDGLGDWLATLWRGRRRMYYLGEWHYHPHASPEASAQDRAQMVAVAREKAYACPEPLLVILGGDADRGWELRVYVFPVHEGCISLRRIEQEG
ncbi:MAG: Mov34/MPN/PAD-1 family protein [Minicystis sp.]